MKRLCFVMACVSLLLSFNANAVSPFGTTQLARVVVHDFGTQVLLYLPTAVSNGESCGNSNLLVIEKSHPFFKELYAAVLSTFQADGYIQGWVHGCNATFNAPILVRLDLVR